MRVYAFFTLLFYATNGWADKASLPRFVSLKSNEINERVGPGADYPVAWVYVRAGLPVEITAEFDNWRKIRDQEGTEGWVHQSMLSAKRHGIICGAETTLHTSPDEQSQPLVRLAPNVMVEIVKCRGNWCQIRVNTFKGWIQRQFLWGVYPHEELG
jgi:SH3-like domain-containing protein